jgi:hypothetical protein
VTTSVPLLTREQAERLPERSRAVVEYRKSGTSRLLGARLVMRQYRAGPTARERYDASSPFRAAAGLHFLVLRCPLFLR